MPFLSINELHQITGKTRATVTKMLDGVPFKEGPKKAMLYDTKIALAKIYQAADADGEAFVNAPEAQRLLTIARRQQIDLEMEVTRGDRWPKDDVEAIHEASLSNVAGLLKAHEGKPLSAELIRDIFTELREVPAKLAKL